MVEGKESEIVICDHVVRLGDYVEVSYKDGGMIKGEIVELWDDCPQARVKSGWCFHDWDKITRHLSN